ncbi:alpha-beta hydrolase superfamily lysophospholipase [Alkalispirillum mobile]|uniref:Alpha-beta hydrolase superfamily lysophospholipase n=1 Tax=Alkalispirillum mobile TaxID=85925 RepID=A0A498C604_9GAMM|nr:alpha/beta hydrolase [Alkalispirillum mobile]RLK50447.1 alpha-beta hydrolase superfamily lysophospholipase [Alkalispirillum mobile]
MRSAVGFILFVLTTSLLLTGCEVTGATAQEGQALGGAEVRDGYIRTADGEHLRLLRHGPEQTAKAVVLALHGLNDRAEAFDSLGATLAEEGIALYSFDQRSFGASPRQGRWPGEDALIQDAVAILEALRQRYPGRTVHLAGESMGGAVAIRTAVEAPEAADSLILLAPATWGRATQPWYQRLALWVGVRVMPGRTFTGESLGVRPTDNDKELRVLGRDPLFIKETRVDTLYGLTNLMDHALEEAALLETPTLLLYGANDEIIPPRAICALVQRLPPPLDWHLAWYPDGWHMLTRDLNGSVVRHDIAAWADSPSPPLPSGHLYSADDAESLVCDR